MDKKTFLQFPFIDIMDLFDIIWRSVATIKQV